MNRVLRALAQWVVLLATVMSPVAVSATQIANDFESIPDALENELVPQDSEDSQHASIESEAIDSTASKVHVPQAESAQVLFTSNSPTVSFGSDSSSCCDVAGGGDISSLMVFAQPRPFASLVEIGSLKQFTDSSAGFSQSLAPSSGQSDRGRATGGTRAQGVRSSAGRVTARSGACGCVGGDCGGGSESGSGLITAVARMVKNFANCLFLRE